MFDLLAALQDGMRDVALLAGLVFVRIGAIVFLLPGFGEMALPGRLRLGVAVAMTVLVTPALEPSALPGAASLAEFTILLLTEAAIGLMIGLATRLMVHGLQLAGSIAAQSTALAQIAGAGVAPDPMPAMGNALLLSGITLSMVLGLHVKAVIMIIDSYQTLGFGALLPGFSIAEWGIDQAVAAFALGFTLAAPFIIAAFLYNLALGAINRAMPQLMVAFIGAPAITAGTLFLFLLAAPIMVAVWNERLDGVLAAPLALRR